MVQMEEGNIKNKENDTENVNLTAADATCNESVDVIISAEEVQPESKNICQKIISDIIDNIATQEVNLEAFCQNILLDILEKIEMRQPSPDHEVVPDNQITNINQSAEDEILQIYEEEIILDQVPLMQENIVPEGEYLITN